MDLDSNKIDITVFNQKIAFPFNQSSPELSLETTNTINDLIKSEKTFEKVEKIYVDVISPKRNFTDLNETVKSLGNKNKDILVASLLCALHLLCIATTITAFTLLLIFGSPTAAAGLVVGCAFGIALGLMGSAFLTPINGFLLGCGFRSCNALMFSIFLSPFSPIVEALWKNSDSEDKKEVLETAIRKDISNLMQIFTKDNIKLLRQQLDNRIEDFGNLNKPTQEEINKHNKNLEYLRQLEAIEDLVESIQKQISAHSTKKIASCTEETLLANLPQEILPLIGNYSIIN